MSKASIAAHSEAVMSSGFKSPLIKTKSSKPLSIANATALTSQMQSFFSEIKDPRVPKTRAHLLADILIIGIMMLRLKSSLRAIQSGSIRVFGRELYGASKSQLVEIRKQIGFIFQTHNLLESLTAQQNVGMSLRLHKDLSVYERTIQSQAILTSVLTGLVVFVVLSAIPLLGGIFELIITLMGLGAVWLWGQRVMRNIRHRQLIAA
jgi:hypothetical protein